MIDIVLPDDHVWLRLTKPHYDDPLDTSHAQRDGSRSLWRIVICPDRT